MDNTPVDGGRREVMKFLGGMSVVGTTTLAGCSDTESDANGGGENDDGPSESDDGTGESDDEMSESEGISRGGDLEVAIAADPPAAFHPHFIRSAQGVIMARTYASSLFIPNPDGTLNPQIASSIEEGPDAMEFVVSIRDDVTFHPPYDRQLTASDVVDNFHRILDEEYGSPDRDDFVGFLVGDGIDPEETVRETGEFEVTFELEEPFADFVNSLSGVFIVPMEAVDEYGDDFGTMDVGTWAAGPFTFEEGSGQDFYAFERFDNYFEEGEDGESLPYVDSVTFNIVPEGSVRSTQLETEEAHIIDGVPPRDSEELEANSDVQIQSVPSVTRACNFINQANHEAFQKQEVRQALMYAVNREAIINIAYNGYAKPGWGVFPPWHWAHNDDATQTYPHDPERAEELLAEAGEADLSFECLVPNSSPFTDIATVVQQNYDAVGIDMEITTMEESAVWDPVLGKWGNEPPGPSSDEFESNIQTLSVETYADSFAFWKYHSGDFLNVTYYDQSDDIIQSARETTDREERQELYAQLEAEVTEYVDRIALVWPDVIHGTQANVHNYDPHPNGRVIVKDVWIE